MIAIPRIDELRQIVGDDHVLTGESSTQPYLVDWRRTYRGAALAIVRPGSTAEVSRCVAWAASTGTPVVPQGGNTGMSGGATPDRCGNAIVLSLERLKRIRALNHQADYMEVEAGCLLADVRTHALAAGRIFPLGLGSEGSCQIGGNIATDAGGVEAIRYGTMRDLVLGLEVVLPNAQVLDMMSCVRKDTSGYNLKHLFIGSEGTLGIITAATLKLHRPPAQTHTAFCALHHPADGLVMLDLLRTAVGNHIAKCEMMSAGQLSLVLDHHPTLTNPLAAEALWYLFIEIALDSTFASTSSEMFEQLLMDAIEAGTVLDAVLAQSQQQAKNIWEIRELVSDANRRSGRVLSTDTAVPLEAIPTFLERTEAALASLVPAERRLYVGHIGDGNVHVVVVFQSHGSMNDETFRTVAKAVRNAVFDITVALGGSISAEHGVGQALVELLPLYKSSTSLETMAAIKRALDPLGIMNPGKITAVN